MKYFVGLLMFCLLNTAKACTVTAPSESCSTICVDANADVPGSTDAPADNPDSDSPAGGPGANSNSAVCYFYRSSNCIVCKKGGLTQKCCAQAPTKEDDTKSAGPPPYNEYLIGEFESKVGLNGRTTPWHNLYPKKADNSGYFGYYEATETGRKNFGLHLGTVHFNGIAVRVSTCWESLTGIITSGNLQYQNEDYDGFLYVVKD